MPSLKAIENPENDLSSELISSDGVSLGRYFRYNRSQVTYDQLSDDLVNTLLLSEDHRFYKHSGMDFWAYPRVLWGLLTFNSAGGGSTITQQLAKNLYTINPELDGHLARSGQTSTTGNPENERVDHLHTPRKEFHQGRDHNHVSQHK